ncbi:growth arrest and DNA damage-inducible proteins-interacting protein CRIF [Lycorma delicatula]|uniref:growth arrest and DNA damage-inducible proteins-interacting protein CRIF n=1 Tax=Lycorma delicatula TaxID=130591 RepID=UPI003F518D56
MAILLSNRNFNLTHAFKTIALSSVNVNTLRVKQFSADSVVSDLPEEIELLNTKKEADIESKRNVSRLNVYHRNLLLGKVPYPEPKADFHLTVKYRRKMYGLYGGASKVNPGIMWPTKEDIKERKEYESVAYPFTIQEMVRNQISKKEAEEAEILERQKTIGENKKKLNQWMKDLEAKRAKKMQVAIEAKAKKDRLIEEVRRHFGYTVNPREERFQQMLEQKEREEKKALKIEKKKKREEMFLQEIMVQTKKEDKM